MNIANVQSATSYITLIVQGGSANIDQITADSGLVSLFVDGAILDRRDAAAATTAGQDALQNLSAVKAVLKSGLGIGTSANWFETHVTAMEVASERDMWVLNFGNMTVGNVSPTFGGIKTKAALHLALHSTLTVDEPFDSGGGDIVVTADNGVIFNSYEVSGGGSITVDAGTFITFNSPSGVPSYLDTQSGSAGVTLNAHGGALTMADGTYVSAADGPITVTTTGGDATIALLTTTGIVTVTAGGSILDADTTGANDIVAGNLTLTATGSIGTAANAIETNYSAAGDIGAITAGTGIYLTETAGGLRLSTVRTTTGDIVITVPDTAAAGEDIVMADATDVVEATAGSVTLLAGDNVVIGSGAHLTAGTFILVQGDYGKADSVAATITVSADAVIFAGTTVTMLTPGAVTVQAATVSGDHGVTITAGGSLTVTGGTGVVTSGDIALQASSGLLTVTGAHLSALDGAITLTSPAGRHPRHRQQPHRVGRHHRDRVDRHHGRGRRHPCCGHGAAADRRRRHRAGVLDADQRDDDGPHRRQRRPVLQRLAADRGHDADRHGDR